MTLTILCLAVGIYYEARDQPVPGQRAVANVILTRMADPRWPDTACDVIYDPDQFSFVLDGSRSNPIDRAAMEKARRIALGAVLVNRRGESTHYHADYTQPDWSLCKRPTKVIGEHVFYELRKGE